MPHDNTSSRPSLPELSDKDVRILCEIIGVSSQAPNIHHEPCRAIFAAYDEVLGKYGISSGHDQLYLRFLFRLGERLRQDGDGEEKDLVTEFEALLLELGYQLEIGSETESDFQEDEGSLYDENTEERVSRVAPAVQQIPPASRRQRRASFSEIFDSSIHVDRVGRERPESPASISRLQDTSDGFGSRPFQEMQRQAAYDDAFPYGSMSAVGGGRLKQNATTTQERPHHTNHDYEHGKYGYFKAHNPRDSVLMQNRSRRPVPNFHIYEDHVGKEALPQKALSTVLSEPVPKQDKLVEAEMRQEADTLRTFHFQKRVRNLVQRWFVAVRKRKQLLQVAIHRDSKELLRQAWDELLSQYQIKKEAAEIRIRDENVRREAVEHERYLEWREQNAAKARDVYLVGKAFSHWTNLASERVEENTKARQHLLRLRFFNAWKEITAVNELKVRRAVLQRFLNLWRRNSQHVANNKSQVLAVRERNLVQATYLNWVRHFCERRAPIWRSGRLAQKYFLKWIVATRIRAEQRLQATKIRQEHDQRIQLRRFMTLAKHNRSLNDKAQQFRDQKLVSRVLSNWKRKTTLASIACQVSVAHDRRLASAAFALLKHRWNAEQQAQGIYCRRVLRNAWKTWNNNLRIATMRHHSNDKLMLQMLYNWVLAERGALMKRVHDERLQNQVLCKLQKQKTILQRQSRDAETQALQLRKRSMQRMVWRTWLEKYQRHRTQTDTAIQTHRSRVEAQIMHKWYSEHEHLSQISKWSTEAINYFYWQRFLKKWQAKTKEKQSQKRREAYAVVKKAYQTNLAVRALQEWKYRFSQIKANQSIEQEFQSDRTDSLLFACFQHWTQRTVKHLTMSSQATDYDSNKLASRSLTNWNERMQIMSGNIAKSIAFYDSCARKNAYDSLRRLQLKILELRSYDTTASSVLAWTTKRRARGLLRAWAERAASRQLNKSSRKYNDQDRLSLDSGPLLPNGTALISLARTPRINRRNQPSSFLPPTQPVHPPFTDLPVQTPFYALAKAHPHPLTTPSHRAARAKALSQAQTPFHPPATREITDLSSQDPGTTTSPPSDESSHQTGNTSPQLSESRTTTRDDQTHLGSKHRFTLVPAESPRLFHAMPSREITHVPATDVQPQRKRLFRQIAIPARGDENTPAVSSIARASVRRSLFPDARSAD